MLLEFALFLILQAIIISKYLDVFEIILFFLRNNGVLY